jgi:ABC-type uncharacterized transport system substrate-binding protein
MGEGSALSCDPSMHGSPRAPSVVRRALALAALVGTASGGLDAATGPVIVRMAGRGGTAPLSAALVEKLPGARVVELTGDLPADTARISRETRGIPVLFAIGPDATEAAGEARGPAVVSLGVANPAQVKTPGIYVSIYPNLDRVFEYVKTTLKATRAGLVFSPAKNREIGLQFLKAAAAQGVTVLPITIGSSGDLVRELKGALPKVDALLLAVDPVLFDERNLEFIVKESLAAGKPTVGFLEDLAKLGVTVALVAPADQVAAAAVAASAQPVLVGKKRVEVDGIAVIVSRKAATAIGLEGEALIARKLE